MAEGWTRAETRRRHRWCEGKGYANGAPVCGGRAAKLTDEPRKQLCQRCSRRALDFADGNHNGHPNVSAPESSSENPTIRNRKMIAQAEDE